MIGKKKMDNLEMLDLKMLDTPSMLWLRYASTLRTHIVENHQLDIFQKLILTKHRQVCL